MAFDDLHNTGLSLGSLFSHLEQPKKQYFELDHPRHRKRKAIFYSDKFTNLSLAFSSDHQVTSKSSLIFDASKVHDTVLNRQASSISVVSSISSSVKRDRDASGEQVKINIVNQMKSNILSMSHSEETGSREGEMKIKSVYNSKLATSTCDDQNIEEEEEGGPRKKLRLSKQQSLILEDTFKEHITLNPKQKQALAKQLNLRARQVEVWFQNRRARTKLKQTEIECELLKKLCKTLTDENRKLGKEVHELKALKGAAAPFYMQLPPPAPTLSIFPSCERAGEPAVRHRISSKPRFSRNNNHSSAAC